MYMYIYSNCSVDYITPDNKSEWVYMKNKGGFDF